MTPHLDVLVVEDEPSIAQSIASALRRRGHEVQSAGSVEDALLRPDPDVVVTDLSFHEGASGFELLESIASRGLRPHVVVVTGMPTLTDCRRAMQLGARDILPKPFHLEELVVAVEQPLRTGSGAGRRLQRRYPADSVGARQALRDLLAFALERGIAPSARGRIGSACAEVVGNVCVHAHGESPGELELSADRDRHELVVTIRDRGAGFDALEAAVGPMQDAPGSGLARAACLCEDLRIEAEPDGGTRINLLFHTHPSTFAEEVAMDLSELDYLDPETSRRLLNDIESGEESFLNMPPALAVTVGRLLTGVPDEHNARTALWG